MYMYNVHVLCTAILYMYIHVHYTVVGWHEVVRGVLYTRGDIWHPRRSRGCHLSPSVYKTHVLPLAIRQLFCYTTELDCLAYISEEIFEQTVHFASCECLKTHGDRQSLQNFRTDFYCMHSISFGICAVLF